MIEELVQVHIEDLEYQYPEINHLRKWIRHTVSEEQNDLGHINIIFCTDQYLLKYNQEYLGHDYYTDIITFEYEQSPIEGDLYISLDRVRENAEERDIQLIDEVDRVIIHGILHLLGYQDKTEEDKRIMKQKEDHYLSNRPQS